MSEESVASEPGFLAPNPYVPLPARLTVLLSGRGTNFEALAASCEKGEIPGRIVLVLSDNPAAPGLRKAERLGIPAKAVAPPLFRGREAREAAFESALEEASADLVCLAGYMKILSPGFVSRHRLRILNIHPSLLPAFPGLEAQEQAVRYGVRVSGATVHFVDEGTDTGPIVGQRAVPLEGGDDAEALAARILPVEHALYPACVRRVLLGGWRLVGRVVTFPVGNP